MNHLQHPVKRLWVSDMSPVCLWYLIFVDSIPIEKWRLRCQKEMGTSCERSEIFQKWLDMYGFRLQQLELDRLWILILTYLFPNCGNKKSKKIVNARSRLYHLTWILTPIHVAFWKSPHRADDRLPTTAWRYTLFSDTYHTQADYHTYIYIHVYYVYPMR